MMRRKYKSNQNLDLQGLRRDPRVPADRQLVVCRAAQEAGIRRGEVLQNPKEGSDCHSRHRGRLPPWEEGQDWVTIGLLERNFGCVASFCCIDMLQSKSAQQKSEL